MLIDDDGQRCGFVDERGRHVSPGAIARFIVPPMLARTAGSTILLEPGAFNEPRHEDRAAIEVRYRIIGRQALRGIVLPLQESQDRGVALSTGTRPGGGKRAGDPRVAVPPVDAEDVGLVHTELRRRDRVNAVAIPQMSE